MHSIATTNSFMSYDCAQAAYKLGACVWVVLAVIHNYLNQLAQLVYKLVDEACGYAQSYTFLCTVYRQLNQSISSVSTTVVHTIHTAYIYESRLKKGIF